MECRRNQRWRNHRWRNLRCHWYRGRLCWVSTRRIHDNRWHNRLLNRLELCEINRLATRRRRSIRVWAPVGFALCRVFGGLDVAGCQHVYWSSCIAGVCILLDSGFPKFTDEFSRSRFVLGLYGFEFVRRQRISERQQHFCCH
jgi:hypothetical protein